jgi:hypothetical protein
VAAESFRTPCAAIVFSVSNCGVMATKASAAWKVALAVVIRPSRSVCVSVAVYVPGAGYWWSTCCVSLDRFCWPPSPNVRDRYATSHTFAGTGMVNRAYPASTSPSFVTSTASDSDAVGGVAVAATTGAYCPVRLDPSVSVTVMLGVYLPGVV